jgi:PIN domain nuclease of toxin-antitoxin system
MSAEATRAVSEADELAIAAISWFELAWLAEHGRLTLRIPLRSWLEQLARELRTAPLTPAIAAAAVALPPSFPRDPADRMIYATAREHGWRLVTKDGRLLGHDPERGVALW